MDADPIDLSTILYYDEAPKVPFASWRAALKELAPGAELAEFIGPDEDGNGILKFDGMSIAIMTLPVVRPIENLVNDPSPHFQWKTAKEDLADYKAHSRVFIMDKPDPKDRPALLRAARKLTLLTAALCEITSAKGVLWSAANQLVKAGRFVLFSRELATKGETPAQLWVRLLTVNTGVEIKMGTLGLAPYAGRELELPSVSEEHFGEIALNVMQLAQSMIEGNNLDLKAGEIIRSYDNSMEFNVVRIGDGYFDVGPATILKVAWIAT